MLHFRVTEQGPIKLMRHLVNRVVESVSSERELAKELKQVAERLQTADKHQEQDLHPDQANLILGKALFIDFVSTLTFNLFFLLKWYDNNICSCLLDKLSSSFRKSVLRLCLRHRL